MVLCYLSVVWKTCAAPQHPLYITQLHPKWGRREGWQCMPAFYSAQSDSLELELRSDWCSHLPVPLSERRSLHCLSAKNCETLLSRYDDLYATQEPDWSAAPVLVLELRKKRQTERQRARERERESLFCCWDEPLDVLYWKEMSPGVYVWKVQQSKDSAQLTVCPHFAFILVWFMEIGWTSVWSFFPPLLEHCDSLYFPYFPAWKLSWPCLVNARVVK